MKVLPRIILSIMLAVLWLAGLSFAGNPTQYISLHGDYGQARPDNHGNFLAANIYRSGFIGQWRVFIPPGSTIISADVLEWNGQSCSAHFGSPPTIGYGSTGTQNYTLAGLTSGGGEFFQGWPEAGRLGILGDGFGAPFLPESQSGWLYVNCGGFAGSSSYYIEVQVWVNAAAYNSWHDSINWDRDVESVTIYGKPVPTPTPLPQPTPTPMPTPAPTPTPIPGIHTFDFGALGVWDWNGTALTKH